jgi:hypothetical protein
LLFAIGINVIGIPAQMTGNAEVELSLRFKADLFLSFSKPALPVVKN